MRKVIFAILTYIIMLSFSASVYATDLPIDISIIRRQGEQSIPINQIAPRVGADLFTADAQRINEALANQVSERQEKVSYLFETVPYYYEPDVTAQIQNSAESLALFANPTSHTNFRMVQQEETLSNWTIAIVLAVCTSLGFILALMSRARKRRIQADVH